MALPLAPVCFAQACRHGLASVLDRDDQPRFLLCIARGTVHHANGFVGTLGDDDAGTRLDMDALPRLV
jgi:hypothetical protein